VAGHLLARGFYSLIGPRPILMTRRVQVATNKQLTANLFCRGCEDRFNKGGERWVIANCWRSAHEFPLREALLRSGAVVVAPEGALLPAAAAPAVDVGQLAYFAASVFWRAAVPGWPPLVGQPVVPLELGSQSEELRLYLLGKAGFPANAALFVYVSLASDPIPVRANMNPPKFYSPAEGQPFHRFLVCGITFDLFVGASVTNDERESCFVRSSAHIVFGLPAMDEWHGKGVGALMSNGTPSKALRDGRHRRR
jgi:hypothetical protein